MTPPESPTPPSPRATPTSGSATSWATVFGDDDFADLYPRRGQPAVLALAAGTGHRPPVPRGPLRPRRPPTRSAPASTGSTLLGLELDDPGFDASVLCEFRSRLLAGEAEERLLEKILERARALGLLKARGRQRTDATHVLASSAR